MFNLPFKQLNKISIESQNYQFLFFLSHFSYEEENGWMPGPSQVAEQEDIISVSPSPSLSSTMTSPPSQPPPSKKKKIGRGTDIDEAIYRLL